MFDRFGPCEDDYESTCPYLGILPEESNAENGSPLNFETGNHRCRVGDDEEPEEHPFYLVED